MPEHPYVSLLPPLDTYTNNELISVAGNVIHATDAASLTLFVFSSLEIHGQWAGAESQRLEAGGAAEAGLRGKQASNRSRIREADEKGKGKQATGQRGGRPSREDASEAGGEVGEARGAVSQKAVEGGGNTGGGHDASAKALAMEVQEVAGEDEGDAMDPSLPSYENAENRVPAPKAKHTARSRLWPRLREQEG